MDFDSIRFKKSNFEGMPENSVVLKFPTMTLTIFQSKKKIYAELLEKNRRVSFEGQSEDPEAEIRESVNKVMAKLKQVITITKMNK